MEEDTTQVAALSNKKNNKTKWSYDGFDFYCFIFIVVLVCSLIIYLMIIQILEKILCLMVRISNTTPKKDENDGNIFSF